MWNTSNEKAKDIVENVCPYCNEHFMMNKRSFANHVRWCKSNPRYEEIRGNTIKKCIDKSKLRYDKELGEIKEFTVKCANPKCGKEFMVKEREKQFPSKEKYYCCRSCANSREKSLDSKKKTSESLKAYMRSINRKPSEDIFLEGRVCQNCGKVFHSRKIKQTFCCNKCGAEYRNRKHYEALLDGCTDVERIKLIQDIYRKQCNFKFALNAYPDEFEFALITENGWYKAKNHGDNLKGVSRDHMFSVNDGFRLKIDPYLISHPANCSLMVHPKNSSKSNNSSITFDELKERIAKWEEKYGEYENKIDYQLLSEVGYMLSAH